MNRVIKRKPLLGAALSTLPGAIMGLAATKDAPVKVAVVPSGEDRFGQHREIGVSLSDFKVSSDDCGGGLFVMEHTNKKKGGPPRHLHHNEDEWYYVIAGEYVVEVGAQRFELRSGDSLLAPREIPHAYAFVGETSGKLIISFAPGKNMERFFRDRPATSGYRNNAEPYKGFGMELLGPPLDVK